MPMLQKMLTNMLSPATVERMKAESNQWQLRCTGCGKTKLLWDAGGVRYKKKSVGSASATLARCTTCRKWRWTVIERRPEP